MTVAIMQPYFLPYIGYFQLLNTVDKFVLYDDVNFINRGWVNRNSILLGGKPHLFTVPLDNASQNKLIHEVKMTGEASWRKKLIKTVQQAYQKAPYFPTVFPIFEEILHLEATDIADLVYRSLLILKGYMGIETELVRSSRIYENSSLKGQARILDICNKEGATQYINPIGGQELYGRAHFEAQGIQLNFIKSNPHPYPQFKNAFVPWLSILDVLMFNDMTNTQELLLDFELV
ncbi:WbqC family protein [Salmonirosea aquatica]|uniref:WbqC family protein n=1 Tax=Salmonirosea aquatica TaxID=2654236 RepID=A0A7C9BVE9_9BACT|nr:hypothetical protein [Cytophagaceae bacterium SJW1-29]